MHTSAADADIPAGGERAFTTTRRARDNGDEVTDCSVFDVLLASTVLSVNVASTPKPMGPVRPPPERPVGEMEGVRRCLLARPLA